MSRDPFGWEYPAGADEDPDAPWNDVEDDEDDEDRAYDERRQRELDGESA